jgi:methylmalonyl-CoA mutase N-terminal domain/subunit
MYLVVAEKQGADWKRVSGTIQNDILKEYIAQHSYIYPPKPSLRLFADTVEFCTAEVPKWNTISISGYHIREAGSTAVQELAFTLANGICYVEACIARGLRVDDFAPRLSFFFDAHMDFFEEIAKFRAARRMWSKIMKEHFGARDPRSLMLRFHTQTAGCSLAAQQPTNNVVRTAIEAMAAVLGGTQSLHTNALDETLALPTEAAAEIALRTQQIIAYESGIPNVADPFAGSYFMESLTREMEDEATAIIAKIDAMGGMLAAIDEGYPQREIMDASMRYQKQLEKAEKIVVGMNAFTKKDEETLPILKIDDSVELAQVEKLKRLRAHRKTDVVVKHQALLKRAAAGTENLMPVIVNAVRDYVTVGEICGALREVWGEYHDPAHF